METQPCVVDLKDPVNKGFDQPQLVTKRCKTQKVKALDSPSETRSRDQIGHLLPTPGPILGICEKF